MFVTFSNLLGILLIFYCLKFSSSEDPLYCVYLNVGEKTGQLIENTVQSYNAYDVIDILLETPCDTIVGVFAKACHREHFNMSLDADFQQLYVIRQESRYDLADIPVHLNVYCVPASQSQYTTYAYDYETTTDNIKKQNISYEYLKKIVIQAQANVNKVFKSIKQAEKIVNKAQNQVAQTHNLLEKAKKSAAKAQKVVEEAKEYIESHERQPN